MSQIKDRIRNHPRLFDILKRISRLVSSSSDPTYEFIRSWSKNRQINFVQIGASDGLRNDPYREFIIKGWRGILVEPLPTVFELLKANYSGYPGLTFVNAAITSKNGTLPFWSFNENFLRSLPLETRLDYLRKASFNKAHVEHFLPKKYFSEIIEIPVPCMTFSSLIENFWPGGSMDLLAIDAEQHELEILRSIDFDRFKPGAVFYEAQFEPLVSQLSEFMNGLPYRRHVIGGDTFAIRKT